MLIKDYRDLEVGELYKLRNEDRRYFSLGIRTSKCMNYIFDSISEEYELGTPMMYLGYEIHVMGWVFLKFLVNGVIGYIRNSTNNSYEHMS